MMTKREMTKDEVKKMFATIENLLKITPRKDPEFDADVATTTRVLAELKRASFDRDAPPVILPVSDVVTAEVVLQYVRAVLGDMPAHHHKLVEAHMATLDNFLRSLSAMRAEGQCVDPGNA
jgi:hypothetical protein